MLTSLGAHIAPSMAMPASNRFARRQQALKIFGTVFIRC